VTVAVTYFEDVKIGDVEVGPAMTLTETHAALYRGLTGESPEAAVIPELLPLCVATGLGWRMPRAPLAVLAFMSFDWKIHRELRVGDTIHGRARVALKRSMREGGVIIEDHELIDQHGTVAQGGRFVFLVAKRTGGSDRPAASPADAGVTASNPGGQTT
jgi:hypothetical protein